MILDFAIVFDKSIECSYLLKESISHEYKSILDLCWFLPPNIVKIIRFCERIRALEVSNTIKYGLRARYVDISVLLFDDGILSISRESITIFFRYDKCYLWGGWIKIREDNHWFMFEIFLNLWKTLNLKPFGHIFFDLLRAVYSTDLKSTRRLIENWEEILRILDVEWYTVIRDSLENLGNILRFCSVHKFLIVLFLNIFLLGFYFFESLFMGVGFFFVFERIGSIFRIKDLLFWVVHKLI